MPAFDLLLSALKSEAGFTDAQCAAVRQCIVGLPCERINSPRPRAMLMRDVRATAARLIEQDVDAVSARDRLIGMGIARRTAHRVLASARKAAGCGHGAT